MAEEITRILIELISQLPPEMRPGASGVLMNAAATQSLWQPAVVMLLFVVFVASLHLYVESMDG